MRDFEILRFTQRRGGNNRVGAAVGQAVTSVAGQSGRVLVYGEIEFAGRRIATVGKYSRQSAVKVFIGVRLENYRIDEVAVSLHIRPCKDRAAEQAVKGSVEMRKVGAITSPMERI